MERKSLSDILSNGSGSSIREMWHNTDAAGELDPLPAGEYVAHIIAGELTASRSNQTPGYKLAFKVAEGNFAGRQFWHDCWLTPAAMPQTKRDLSKLGIVNLEQLEKPLPRGIRCRCKVVLRRDDDGNEHNRVRRFDVIGVDQPEADAFAPSETPTGSPADGNPTTPAPDATEATGEARSAGAPF